jgi:trehalose synthase-fused probable maltokinase
MPVGAREVARKAIDGTPTAEGLADVIAELAPALPAYLAEQRWFGSKGRPEVPAALVVLEVSFAEGSPEMYLLPVAARARAVAREAMAADVTPLAELSAPDGIWLLYDAAEDPAAGVALLRHIEEASRLTARRGSVVFERTPGLSPVIGEVRPDRIRPVRGEQSNTSIVYDDRLILKLFRQLAPGENPELEMSRFLTLRMRFPHTPTLAGAVHYQSAEVGRTLAVLQAFVSGTRDGWTWTLGALHDFYAAAEAESRTLRADLTAGAVAGLAGPYLAGARRLGEVTGELHGALASAPGDPTFAPEPVTETDLAAWRAAVEAELGRGLAGLRAAPEPLTRAHRATVERILAASPALLARVAQVTAELRGTELWKTRIHGDYHLGQVLRRGGPTDEFVVLDFEGEPARPLAARRARQSPLRDVAGMLRSFTYASYAALFEMARLETPAMDRLSVWREGWEAAASAAFLDGYRAATVGRSVPVVPVVPEARAHLLSLFCLEKAAYELSYELNNRPTWLPIPLAAFTRELARQET